VSNILLEQLEKLSLKEQRYIIGLMSGTSVDGLDVALVKVSGTGKNMNVELLSHRIYNYPKDMVEEIKNCFSIDTAKVDKICELNFWLGNFYSEKILEFLKSEGINKDEIDCIASHGQTIHHLPNGKYFGIPSTLQIGELDVISKRTGIITVGDFRTKDVAAGGQGAPLVSYIDYILYSDEKKSVAINNLGGISNLTYLPKKCTKSDVIAFDTGPANALIDLVANTYFGLLYDRDGKLASSGNINQEFFERLMDIEKDFVEKKPPKTTGKEIYNAQYLKDTLKRIKSIDKFDLIATITYFTAWSIYENYRLHIIPRGLDKVFFSGGGVKNSTLMNHLREFFETDGIEVDIDDRFSKAKEAVCMAILAHEFLNGVANNVPSATGASEEVICGKISFPF